MSDSDVASNLHTARLLGKKLSLFKGDGFKRISSRDLPMLMETGTPGKVNIIFRFLIHPTTANPTESGVIQSIECEKNKLVGQPYKQKAERDPYLSKETLKADLAITCIGYYSTPLPGIGQFDEKAHIIPNSHGCVLSDKQKDYIRVGTYCAGWVKTGAKGIIDTTMKSAEETYNNLKNHVLSQKLVEKHDPLEHLKAEFNKARKRTTTFQDWKIINEKELELGKQKGKVRHKLKSNNEILNEL